MIRLSKLLAVSPHNMLHDVEHFFEFVNTMNQGVKTI